MSDLGTGYFTPKIEDIRMGDIVHVEDCANYRNCEGCDFPATVSGIMSYPNIWVISNDTKREYELYPQQIRIPYLTKEQIEKEGWIEKTSPLNINAWVFEKGNRFAAIRINDMKNPFILEIIVKDPAMEELIFGLPSEHFRFTCPCKDINTFRYICKLLEINE